VIGGILLGVIEHTAGAYISTALIDISAYLIIIGVLIIRPTGILGYEATVRV
jgi:branched-chain amino acid transport system permease protein